MAKAPALLDLITSFEHGFIHGNFFYRLDKCVA